MKLTQLTLLVSAVIIMASCGSNKSSKKNADHIKPLDIEIPSELKGNDEAVQFIESSEIVINEWSNTLEDLLQETEDFAGKEEADLSMMDKMKLIKISTEFMAKMAEFGVRMSEIESTAHALENGLSEEELAAFEVAYQAFENRMVELGEKYENYGKENQ